MIFETKKVPHETLGEYLTEVRGQLGLSVAEVADKTGIGEKYLLFLEQGRYHHLPPDVYVLGFLKKLAEAYVVPQETLLGQYKKERGIVEHVAEGLLVAQKGLRARIGRVMVTPKLITLAGGVILVVGALGWIGYGVNNINQKPALAVFSPASGSEISGSSVDIAGQTDPGTTLKINDQSVLVDADGKFHATLGVAAGQKELAITAQNKFGKETTQKVLVMVNQPGQSTGQVAEVEHEPALVLDLKFTKSNTVIVTQDSVDLEPEAVAANTNKIIKADRRIILQVSDAGGVIATLNGKPLGTLGRSRESVIIPFTVDNPLVSEVGKPSYNP